MIQQLQFASPPHSAPGTLPFSLFLLEPAQSGHHKRYAAFPPTSFPPKMLHRGSVKPIVHSSIEDLVTQQLQRNEMDGILQDSCPAPSHLPKSVVDGVVMFSRMQIVLFSQTLFGRVMTWT